MKINNAKTFLRAGALLAVAFTGGNMAQAQSCNVSWTGNAGDALWSTAGNWSTNQVPGPTSDVCILTAPSDQGACAPVGCVYAIGVPSISIHSLQVDGGVGLFFGSGTVSITTSLTVQASSTAPNASSVDLYYGTNLNCPIVDVQYGGALLGYGTIEGSLTNNYYIRVDDALTVTGNYTQTTGGELYEFWGRGATGAVLNVNMNATLSGYLEVGTSPKYPPQPGSTKTVMTFGSRSGKFKSASVYGGGTVNYTNNSVVATYK
jgi:hypothetical protein